MKFIYPPSLNTGDVLCKVHLDGYRLNDEFFNSVADAWRPIWAGGANWLWTSPVNVYTGFHLLRSDAKTLVYYMGSSGSDVEHKLYYDGVLVDQCSNGGSAAGTYSLSAKSPGIYYVQSLLVGSDGSGMIRAPFTRYTGSKSYQAPPYAFVDDEVSALADFTLLGDNDFYFKDVMHPNPAFSGTWAYLPGSLLNKDIWWGWDRFHPHHYRMQYNVEIVKTGGNGRLFITYDAGGGNEQSKILTTAGNNTGYWDLASPGNYIKGNYYLVKCTLDRPDDTYDVGTNINYLMMTTPAPDESYTVQDQHVAGQYVYGNTGGQASRLSYLEYNDAAIRDRLIWGDGTTARQDYAVRIPYFQDNLLAVSGTFGLTRRFSLLYYRTQNSQLTWGSKPEQHRLEDYDDAGGFPYRVINLNSLGVQIGQVYHISGGQLHFAMEIP